MLGACKAVGEIDLSTASPFNIVLRDAIDSSEEALVSVDCSALTFMDLAGLPRARRSDPQYATRRGHTLVVRDLSPACARLLTLYDWDHELHIESAPG